MSENDGGSAPKPRGSTDVAADPPTPPGGSATGDDRRAVLRHFTCYPFHIQRGDAGDTADVEIALIHDLSALGAYLLTREEPPVGTRVKLHLDVFEAPSPERVVVGHVLRTERRPVEQADVWAFGVAVQFDAPEPGLDGAIARLAAQAGPA